VSRRRRALVGVVLVATAGQLATIAYEIVVARRFGTGADADALALALTLVVAVGNEIVTWIATLFVPLYVVAAHTSGAAAARFYRQSVAAVLVVTAALAGLLVAGAAPLLGLLAPALADRSSALALLRWLVPLVLLLPLAAVLGSVLQARERFVLAGLRPLCWYGGALVALLFLGRRWGVGAVPVGMVVGLVVFCVALVRAGGGAADVRAGGAESGPTTVGRGLAPLLVPLVLASTANYVNVGVERALAARLPEGSLAALTYASRLIHFPVTLVLMHATTILLPALSVHAARREPRPLEDMLVRALRLALLFAIPLAALSVALAEPLIHLLLERGAFGAESTRLTSTALVWYAPSLIGVAGVQVLARGYQALQAIPRMAAIGMAAVALNLVLMPALTATLGLRGLPLATSTTTVVLLAAMLVGLRARLPGLTSRRVADSALRASVAALAAMVSAWLVREAATALPLARFVAGSVVGVAVYAGVLWWLAREDARLALDFVMPLRWRRV